MAETDEEYQQRRFREARPYERNNGWTTPDQWMRPKEFEGLVGGNDSYSTPKQYPQQPAVEGAQPVGGSTKTVQCVTVSGGSTTTEEITVVTA